MIIFVFILLAAGGVKAVLDDEPEQRFIGVLMVMAAVAVLMEVS